MPITALLNPASIELNARVATKAEALYRLVELMQRGGNLADPAAYAQAVLAREREATTGVGGGLAIPHAKSAAVTAPGLAVLTLAEGVDYQALDGAPVRLLFLLAAPEHADAAHVGALAELARLLLDKPLVERLLAAQTPAELLALLAAAQPSTQTPPSAEPALTVPLIVAVTACPTGIAHTYMAAEALENAANRKNIPLKVETNGAVGPRNVLTPAEIAGCRCVIVAADKAVETDRFAGKPVLRVPVSEAIRAPEQLLDTALSGTVTPGSPGAMPRPAAMPGGPGNPAAPDADGKTLLGPAGRGYRHLMTGLTYMLPFVVVGGLLLALSYMLDQWALGILPAKTLQASIDFLHMIGNDALHLMYMVLAGGIAYSMVGRTGFLPGMLGGMLADYGMSMRPKAYWVPSGFWGAILAGFAAGLLMRLLRRALKKMPSALDGTRTVLLYPAISAVAISAFMVLLVNPWVGHFNRWLYHWLDLMNTDQKVLLGCILGLMMAIDYGGPFSKAAYLFATASLVEGQYGIMAAVMVGGMVPPLGVALACTFFGNRFLKKGRQTTVTNYILGLSFITEGVIPFALRDPLRVGPACMAGSMVAGGLAAAFGCGCPVPHGGIYVLGLMTRPGHFVVALAAGSLITMALLAILKRPLTPEEQESEATQP